MDQTSPTADLGIRALFWRWVRRPGWSVSAPILLIAFAGVFAWQIFFSQSDLEKGMAALVAAHRTARPLETRLAGFSYAPYSDAAQPDEQRLQRAQSLLFVATEKNQPAAAAYARGQYWLAQRKFAEAMQEFEIALKTEANSAQLHNDLGAALLEKATAQRTAPEATQWFTRSREQLEQALRLDRNLSEARFNLALLQFRLGLWQEAEESWQAYLLHDQRSGWAQEAKNYLNRIKTLKQQTTQSQV